MRRREQRLAIKSVRARKARSSYPCLEAAVELGEVGVSAGEGQDALLGHGAVHVIVLQDHILLQHFDGVDLLRPLQLRQHYLGGRTQGGGGRRDERKEVTGSLKRSVGRSEGRKQIKEVNSSYMNAYHTSPDNSAIMNNGEQFQL